MDRRLFDAYDKMTMPDGCSQRIEKRLLEGETSQAQRKQNVVREQRSGWRAWSSAAALVSLAVVISLGGFFLFVEMQKQDSDQYLQPTEIRAETQGGTESEALFNLSEEGKKFLLAMCYAMPDWESYYVLDDRFWEDFLFASFTCPEEVTDGKAKTVVGEAPFENGTVLISREQAEDYARLTMGCDLPVLNLGEEESSSGIQFYDGFYHIHVSDFGSRSYKLRKWVSDSEERCDVMFNVYVDENEVGSVRFKLRKADNKNGFLIVGKQSEIPLPEDTMQVIEKWDTLADLSAEEGVFRQEVREDEFYTAYQYHLPWQGSMVSSKACIVIGSQTEDETGNWVVKEKSQMYRLEGDTWEPVETDTMNLRAGAYGKNITVNISYGEYEEGKQEIIVTPYYTGQAKWVEPSEGSRWWIIGEETTLGEYDTDTIWLLDPVTEELVDLWGAVPRGLRINAVNEFISGADIFEDGCFLSAYLNEDREMYLVYADTVNGKVYDLESIVGRSLEDCVGLPGDEAILCWSGGEYWKIPRDTLYPEYLGKLQENVLYASGVFGGDRALFSIGKEPGKMNAYRIYDYVENRYWILENCERTGEMNVRVSPDGRKLLIDRGLSVIQVLDSEKGTLLNIRRKNWVDNGYTQWLSDEEINIHPYFDEYNRCVYTLK